jgi:nucleotide-binding universal stress UspA family protein
VRVGTQIHATVELIGDEGPEYLVPAITGIAEGVGADPIVLGSRGRAADGGLLGSVSQGVLLMADVPVILVHGFGGVRDGAPATP